MLPLMMCCVLYVRLCVLYVHNCHTFSVACERLFPEVKRDNKTMPLSHMGHEMLCMWVWGPEADIRCFLLLLSTLCFETGSPTKPSTHELARLVGQSPRICKPPCSLNSSLGYWHALLYLAFVPGIWGFRLKPSPQSRLSKFVFS